jgi:hypothetical protein
VYSGQRMIPFKAGLEAKGGWILFALAATLIPVVLCGFMFGFDIASAHAAFWGRPKVDMAVMTAAYEAFIREPWHWPLTTVSGLGDKPISIVFTDSLPWLAIALKATGLWRVLHPMGLFLLASYVLQVWSMIALLRALGVTDRWTLLLGGLLSLMVPAWLARQFGHIALAGHWIILVGLTLSVRSIREGLTWTRAACFAGLFALIVGIHAYHLPPVAAVFGAALLAELLQRRAGGWPRVLGAVAMAIAALAVSTWILDYHDGRGPTGGAAALGVYSMNMVGPFWPQASKLAGQLWTGSWYTGVVDGNGAQAFEGFQYLGAGALLLIAAMAGFQLTAAVRNRGVSASFWVRWTPMTLAMIALTIWAVGWSAYAFKVHVYELPKPKGELAEVVGGFRAHGRFFWAVGYMLLALAITWASRLPRRTALAVLVAALAVQAVDTSLLRHGVRQIFGWADPLAYPIDLTASPKTADRHWTFAPTYYCTPNYGDLGVMRQLFQAIVRNGGSANTYPTARSSDPPCVVTRPETFVDAAPGDRTITVVMANGQAKGGFLDPIAKRTDCYRFGPGVACGRDLDGIKGLTPVKAGDLAGTP